MVRALTRAMVLASLLPAAPAGAIEWTIGAGAGYAPEYEGSADLEPVPLCSQRARDLYGPTTYVDLFATKLTSNLGAHPNLRLGRWSNAFQHAATSRIMPSTIPRTPTPRSCWAASSDGTLLTRRRRHSVSRCRPGAMLRTAMAISLHRRSGFGVSSPDSCRSLEHSSGPTPARTTCPTISASTPRTRPAAVSIGMTPTPGSKTPGSIWSSGLAKGGGWRASLIGRYRRLLDDAADSPVVKHGGDDDQYFAGAAVAYRC
jgi:hypothetical protein